MACPGGGPLCAQDERSALYTPSPCTPTTFGLGGVTTLLLQKLEEPRGFGDLPEVTQPRKPGARDLGPCTAQKASPGRTLGSKAVPTTAPHGGETEAQMGECDLSKVPWPVW